MTPGPQHSRGFHTFPSQESCLCGSVYLAVKNNTASHPEGWQNISRHQQIFYNFTLFGNPRIFSAHLRFKKEILRISTGVYKKI
jgi:hypothetical protein